MFALVGFCDFLSFVLTHRHRVFARVLASRITAQEDESLRPYACDDSELALSLRRSFDERYARDRVSIMVR